MISGLLFRLAGIIALAYCVLAGSSIAIGKLMPGVPIAIFMSSSLKSELFIVRVDTTLKTMATERLELAHPPAWIDQDCRVFLLAGNANRIELVYVDLHNRQERVYLPSPDFNRTSLAVRLPDKRRTWLQYLDAKENVHSLVMDMATGATISVDLPKVKSLQSTRWLWSPDGNYGLLLMEGMDVAHGYLLSTGSGTLTELPITLRQVSLWSPEGRYLAMLSQAENRLIVLDTRSLSSQEYRFPAVAANAGLNWMPDNRLQFIARETEAGTPYQGYRWLPESAALEQSALRLPADYFASRTVAGMWSPDGTRLAVSTGSATIVLDAQTGAELMSLDIPASGGLWSPDSRYLIDHDRRGGVLLVADMRSGQISRFNQSLFYLAERWSPDGTELTLFDTTTSKLGRVLLGGDTPELRMDFQFQDADTAAFCYPETAS